MRQASRKFLFPLVQFSSRFRFNKLTGYLTGPPNRRPTVIRLLKTLGLFLAVATLSCLHAQAQNCGPWLGVTTWQVTYTITGTGSGMDAAGQLDWTIDHQGTGNSVLTTVQTACGTQLSWWGQGYGIGSENDQGVGTCGTPGEEETVSIVGGPTFNSPSTLTFLTIDPANGTYTFTPLLAITNTITINNCGSISVVAGGDTIGPSGPTCGAFGLVTFPLPDTVSTITKNNLALTAPAECGYDGGVAGISWNVSYTLTPTVAPAQPYVDLHDFDPGVNTGKLAQGRDGNFYGESQTVGAGTGNVFKVTPTGTLTVIHSFDLADVALEAGGMTLGTDGNLYGDTYIGGTADDGVTFKITPAGKETPLHNFADSGDGSNPVGALVLGTNGDFYGTTGSNPETIYQVSSAGKLTTLQTLTAAEGYQGGQLIQASDGNFYGGTNLGGANNFGTAFKMTSKGVVTVLHSFNSTDGAGASAGMVEIGGGSFIGTAALGGNNGDGVIYSLTSTGTFAALHEMDGPTDGSLPGVLTAATDGNVYGTAASGGASDCGTIFEVTPSGQFSVLYAFDGTHGCNPEGYLTEGTDGKLYGITSAGGANNAGTFFSLNVGLSPFVHLMTTSGKELSKVEILGQGFSKASVVEFGGVAASTIAVTGSTYISATVPAGALTGAVTVTIGTSTLTSPQTFNVLPTITSFTPPSGPVGTTVTITGTGLAQTTSVTFNKRTAAISGTSDKQVIVTVPAGATTGRIAITTNGGSATSTTSFTVN
jgi:uncharacterized repeat protein (TIGR03803 family)